MVNIYTAAGFLNAVNKLACKLCLPRDPWAFFRTERVRKKSLSKKVQASSLADLLPLTKSVRMTPERKVMVVHGILVGENVILVSELHSTQTNFQFPNGHLHKTVLRAASCLDCVELAIVNGLQLNKLFSH